MKKFLALLLTLLMVLAAFTACAKKAEEPAAEEPAATEETTEETAEAPAADNFDASAYDYVWVKFSGNTGKFRFGITYNEWKSTEAWGETFYDNMKVIEVAEGIEYMPIEKEKVYEFGGPDKAASPYAGDTWDKHVQNVFTQDDGNEVSVTVEGIYFGTEAELEAILGGGEPAPEPAVLLPTPPLPLLTAMIFFTPGSICPTSGRGAVLNSVSIVTSTS